MSKSKIFFSVALVGFMFYMQWNNFQLYRRAQAWPITAGVVLKAEVSDRHRLNSSTWWLGPRQYRRISYSYVVNGRDFVGSRFSTNLGSTFFNIGVKKFLNDYPEGQKVDVHYNPASPEKSYLMVEWIGVSDVLIFILCALLTLYVFREMRRR